MLCFVAREGAKAQSFLGGSSIFTNVRHTILLISNERMIFFLQSVFIISLRRIHNRITDSGKRGNFWFG